MCLGCERMVPNRSGVSTLIDILLTMFDVPLDKLTKGDTKDLCTDRTLHGSCWSFPLRGSAQSHSRWFSEIDGVPLFRWDPDLQLVDGTLTLAGITHHDHWGIGDSLESFQEGLRCVLPPIETSGCVWNRVNSESWKSLRIIDSGFNKIKDL